MQFLKAASAAAALCLGLLATPGAQADVIYTLTQVGEISRPGQTGLSSLALSGTITVSDAAASSGFNLSTRSFFPTPGDPRIGITLPVGLEAVSLRVASPSNFLLVGLDLPLTSDYGPANDWTISLQGGGGATGLTGSLRLLFVTETILLNLQGSTFTGALGSDGLSCGNGPNCTLGGTITSASVVTVPEPASMALFGAGLLGLAAVRRKRAV